MTPKQTVGLHVRLPAALHRAVRVMAAERGETIAALVQRLLAREVAR